MNESIPIDLENAVAVAHVFLAYGLNVVVTYPLSANCHKLVVDRAKFPLSVFTLRPPLEVCLRDRGQRSLSDWERQRISYHYNGGINLDIGYVIDNSCMTSVECAAKILELTNRM